MLAKLNDPTVALWARILNALPESRVLLKSSAFKHAETVSRVLERFGVRGIGAERIDVRDWTADRALYAAAHTTFARLRLLSDYGPSQE